MKSPSFDNSREGSDCWIHEHWFWNGATTVAIKCKQVEGWGPNGVVLESFTEPDDEMPPTVIDWFMGIF